MVKYRVRVIMGEETLETRITEDQEERLASWKEDLLTFYVLKSAITEGKVAVMDEDT